MAELYAFSENYLKAIFMLKRKMGIVRSVDIARYMKYSKCSDGEYIKQEFTVRNLR